MKLYLKHPIFLILFFVSFYTVGQEKIFYGSSYDLLIKGESLYKNKEYKLALEQYANVHEGDSLYFRYAVHMKMAALNGLEEYEKVTEIGDKYWFFRHELPTEFYLNYGTALDKLKQFDKAQTMYESILEEYPLNYSLWYNLGVSYYLEGDMKEAYTTFQKTIEVNPFYDRVHFAMAQIAFSEQQTTKGLMAIGMYLLQSTEKRNNFVELRRGDNVSSTKYWEEESFTGTNGLDLGGNANYAEIDQLVHNYVALREKYKTPSKLSFPLVKQLHLIASRLKEQENDENDFWYRTYGKYYVELMNINKFAGFSYYISSFVENDKAKSIVVKNEKLAKDFYAWSYNYQLANSKEADLTFLGLGKTKVNRNSRDAYIDLLGDFKFINNNASIIGNAKFYGGSGRIVSEGTFNEKGNKDGVWKYYNTNGRLKEQQVLKDGVLGDTSYFYESNGLLSLKLPYVDGKVNGQVMVYDNGILTRTLPYKNDEFATGEFIEYYPIGTVSIRYNVINGKGSGNIEYLYDSGETYRKGILKDGDLNGERTTYFKTGELSYTENFLNDKRNGAYISYYQNGKLEIKGQYKLDNKIGTWEYYFQNGNKRMIQNFDEAGKENGQETEFTQNGIKLSEKTFIKGIVDSFKFFNDKGEVISQGDRKKGNLDYVAYYQNGVKSQEGRINKLGRDGEWKFYRYNGSLERIENFKNGVRVGAREDFYPNGDLEISYLLNEKGEAEGYYKEYYSTKSLFSQGYFKDDERDGRWLTYHKNKSLRKSQFYSGQKLQGFSIDYNVMNRPTQAMYYKDGIGMFEIFYDTAGVAFDTVFQTPGKKELVLKKCADCAVFMTVDVLNNRYHGNQTYFYPDGSIQSKGKMYNGLKNGLWSSYHENGKLAREGNYVSGNSHGEWKHYNDQGVLIRRSNYDNNELHGLYESYDDDGEIDFRANYFYGLLNDEVYYYVGKKQDHQRKYNYGYIESYTFTNQDGKVVTKEMKDETGNIVTYWKNGQKAREFSINKGWFEGVYNKYYENGQMAEQKTYVNDQLNGPFKNFYPTGQLESEGEYEHGFQVGKYTTYYPNGKKRLMLNYVMDEAHGIGVYYKKDGTIERTIHFFNGDVIQIQKK